MFITVHLDRARLFRWHSALIKAFRDRGHQVAVHFRDTSEPLPTTFTAILDFDHVRTHAGPDRFSTRLSPEAFVSDAEPASCARASLPDLSIDLSVASRVKRIDGRVLRVCYDGEPKDYALFHALLDGRAPQLTVLDTDCMRHWDIGLPALEMPSRLATSLDQSASRLVEGLVAIITRIAAGEHAPVPHETTSLEFASPSMLQAAGTFATRRALRKAANIRDRITGNAPRWHVAFRRADGAAPVAGTLNLSDFKILPDDGKRFYADPFLFVRDGACHVFVEELPDDTGTGVISHFTLSGGGEASRPRPVLSTPHHLSYPFVFERDGEIWMLPEQSAGGGLDLYRAAPFPGTWVHEARLIDAPVHDATFFEHDGRLWIAAGTQALQSSTWDALSLFWATSLRGPWTPHAANPVRVDARSARPAGPLWTDEHGRLIRPAQDCSGGYGSRLTLMTISELTPRTFGEQPAGTIEFSAGAHLLGPHTIGRGGGFEVVDLYARPGAVRAGYRSPTTL